MIKFSAPPPLEGKVELGHLLSGSYGRIGLVQETQRNKSEHYFRTLGLS